MSDEIEHRPPRRRKNKETRAREHLTEDEVDRLRKAAAAMGTWGPRNAALVLIGYRHGLRVSELLDVRWENIDLDAKTIYVPRLKDSKPGTHPLERDEIAALRKLTPRSSGHVFLSERGGPLSRRTIAHIVATAGVRAKLPFPAHPHMLRHTCGYCLANRGADTRLIQDWLGHRQIQHTVRYTELSPERFKSLWGRRAS